MSAIAIGMQTQRPAAQRVAPQPARSHLRVTRRGRAVLLGLIATPLVVVALVAGINAGGATATGSAPLSTVTVASGETLWQVATQVAPKADPRDVIADILSVNKLASTDLQPGEKLLIPAQYGR
jgi:LysM repeat protein